MEKEISERIATLTRRLQKLHFLYSAAENDVESEEEKKGGVGVITLGGNNEGATMNVQGSLKNDGEDKSMAETQDESAEHLVNSNVQSVNNSIMFESSSEHRDPGVHLKEQNFSEGGDMNRNKRKAHRRRSRVVGFAKEEWEIPSSKPVLNFLSGSSDED
ncbi:hypothetical protein SUGI_1170480 [Cryptomeria japonica]|uniref:uncharacterized protein LOC131032452 n=1 Tax=Cryptomeria japonica TaxID=3369 RepID=UPI0024149C34|nr:uncharacterized protein LOC131032452 [Cryptomeria japonica]GLJ54498.1 hypothetical protein SUGI_1170480 [Cryptomeria japonica]